MGKESVFNVLSLDVKHAHLNQMKFVVNVLTVKPSQIRLDIVNVHKIVCTNLMNMEYALFA